MIQSPLNYIGGKYKLLPQLLPLFPKDINIFVDLFCGGGNVGVNVECNELWLNDSNADVIKLLELFSNTEGTCLIQKVESIINKYGLSNASKHGYDFYGSNSSIGLAAYNSDAYKRLRNDVNHCSPNSANYYTLLYVLIIYAFNNQIRFNSKHEYNLPIGKRDFNKKLQAKVINFCDKIQSAKKKLSNLDFRRVDTSNLSEDDFVYADPPYLITCATYNESNGWTEQDELDLLSFLDNLQQQKVRFALSNVLENKGKTNYILQNWLSVRSEYKCIHLNYDYSNSNYHSKNKGYSSDEVLIINY